MISLDYWYFTTNNFRDQPDEENIELPIIQNPEDFSEIINELQILSSDPAIPYITAKNFICYFVIKSIPMMRPVYNYLETLINEIVPNDIELLLCNESSLLNITYNVKGRHYINVYYSSTSGMVYHLIYKDENNTIFYSYSFYTEPYNGYNIVGYEISFLFFLSSLSIIGIIYVIKKKINF